MTAGIEASYPTPAEREILKAAEALMEETMSRYDPSHDAARCTCHTSLRRVRKTALHLARSAPGTPDLLTVELAALLDDVLDKKYVSPEACADPYAYFLPFFERTPGVNLVADGRAREVARIVENVSWTTEKRLRREGKWGAWHEGCVELHCVQDADRLDAIGAFGVMRCEAYSAVTNHALHAPEGDAHQPASAIQHFHDKVVHIRERMKTEAGKQMTEKRHKLMVDFLAAVDDEYNLE